MQYWHCAKNAQILLWRGVQKMRKTASWSVCKNSIAEVRQDAFRCIEDQEKIDKKTIKCDF